MKIPYTLEKRYFLTIIHTKCEDMNFGNKWNCWETELINSYKWNLKLIIFHIASHILHNLSFTRTWKKQLHMLYVNADIHCLAQSMMMMFLWERKAKLFDVYFRSILPWEKMSTIYFLQQQKVYKAISR